MKLSRWFSLMALLVAAVFTGSPIVRAQAPNRDSKAQWEKRHQSVEDTLKRWATELNLTDEQKEKIEPILVDKAKKLHDLREDDSLSCKDTMAKVHDIRQDTDDKIKAVLTPDQVKKLDQMRQEERGRMRERHKQGGAPPHSH